MVIKKNSIFLACFLLINSLYCQPNFDDIKDSTLNSNIVKKVCFTTQNNYYPITLSICPYGFWFLGDIYLGHNSNAVTESLRYISFGWEINGAMVETPKSYIYDTISVDTLISKFGTVMNTDVIPSLPVSYIERGGLICISDSLSYANIINELKYTYMLNNIDSDYNLIRVIYPTNSHPYKTSFEIVSLTFISDGNYKMNSISINTVNLLDIKTKVNGTVLLNKKDSKRFAKRIDRTTFNEKVDCSICNQPPFDQFKFIIEFKNGKSHNSFFLCNNLKGRDKNQNEIIDHLTGLKRLIEYLNEKYFY